MRRCLLALNEGPLTRVLERRSLPDMLRRVRKNFPVQAPMAMDRKGPGSTAWGQTKVAALIGWVVPRVDPVVWAVLTGVLPA